MGMTLEDAAKACGGKLSATEDQKKALVLGGAVDSRKIQPGNLFFAIKGEKTDGHKYVGNAFRDGAVGAVVEEVPEGTNVPYILVESTEKALSAIAGYYRSLFSIPVVGITGSVGKTSTKEMIASVLGTKYNVLKTDGNFNNEIGMPLTLLRLREGHEAAVVEMGIDHFGEMTRMTKVAAPDIFVMTNIGTCHLETLGDMDGVFRAKTEGIPLLKEGSPVILNGDDVRLRRLAGEKRIRPCFFSLEDEGTDAWATDIQSHGEEGTDAILHIRMDGKAQSCQVHLNVPGRHMVSNALAGALVGRELGLSIEEIRKGICSMETISGRSNFIHKDGKTIIDDCYNANPASMKASLEVLSHCGGRKIAVLGDMGELGKDEKELHRGVGTFASGLSIDEFYLCGDLMENLAKGLSDGGYQGKVHYYKKKDALLPQLLADVKEGDVVLVKASHFMGFDEILRALVK